jgi:hypothetical protein
MILLKNLVDDNYRNKGSSDDDDDDDDNGVRIKSTTGRKNDEVTR